MQQGNTLLITVTLVFLSIFKIWEIFLSNPVSFDDPSSSENFSFDVGLVFLDIDV